MTFCVKIKFHYCTAREKIKAEIKAAALDCFLFYLVAVEAYKDSATATGPVIVEQCGLAHVTHFPDTHNGSLPNDGLVLRHFKVHGDALSLSDHHVTKLITNQAQDEFGFLYIIKVLPGKKWKKVRTDFTTFKTRRSPISKGHKAYVDNESLQMVNCLSLGSR
jgi:hypothetical protein